MKTFKNLKIGVKLLTSFIIIAMLAGVIGIVGIVNLHRMNDSYIDLYEVYGTPLGDLGMVGIAFHKSRSIVRDIIHMQEGPAREDEVRHLEEVEGKVSAALDRFKQSARNEEQLQAYSLLRSKIDAYYTARKDVLTLVLSGQSEEAMNVMFKISPLAQEASDQISLTFDNRTVDGRHLAARYAEQNNATITLMIAIVISCMALALLFGVVISRMISKPVQKIVGIAEKVADGDLDVRVNMDTRDEIGDLAAVFQRMIQHLNEVLGSIRTASDQVYSGSEQVSSSSVALSQGASDQASAIEQLTASIEEISAQTKQNADNADKASRWAETTRTKAREGSAKMEDMLAAMNDINNASGSISKIIKVIDEIAFQTNILALNAAVEAARAGQYGRGFAVVAEEVRNLAARCANAAQETTDLIEGSIAKAQSGTSIAHDTAAALTEVVETIGNMAELANEIAVSSNEQASGINQVNQGIMQVSQVVQNNSAMSQETAAASEQMSEQARLMNELVNRFRLKQGDPARYGSYGGDGGLDPKVKNMLLGMSARRSGDKAGKQRDDFEAGAAAPKLSDRDFGNY